MFAPTVDTATAAASGPVDPDPWLTAGEVVAALSDRVTERQVRGWIARGLLDGSHPAHGVWLVRRSALETWIKRGQPKRVASVRPEPQRPARLEPQRDRLPRASRRQRASAELDLSIPA